MGCKIRPLSEKRARVNGGEGRVDEISTVMWFTADFLFNTFWMLYEYAVGH